ncbi:hypothetical protein DAEQUDRAFT_235656 [Daedalea quercina L-15889]|uniref:Uncharacterized protein n=1 Tax=Daedalea quercina L-15889 TaxID=1314783 RepID=A0A165QW44_9APHY|nr:hypothetical protein DAEQUDRAFT_235656 [Daedalea quercina L-15889]
MPGHRAWTHRLPTASLSARGLQRAGPSAYSTADCPRRSPPPCPATQTHCAHAGRHPLTCGRAGFPGRLQRTGRPWGLRRLIVPIPVDVASQAPLVRVSWTSRSAGVRTADGAALWTRSAASAPVSVRRRQRCARRTYGCDTVTRTGSSIARNGAIDVQRPMAAAPVVIVCSTRPFQGP